MQGHKALGCTEVEQALPENKHLQHQLFNNIKDVLDEYEALAVGGWRIRILGLRSGGG
jgi:hypothetical protein